MSTFSSGRLTTGCPRRGIACMHNYQIDRSRSRIVRKVRVCRRMRSKGRAVFVWGCEISPSVVHAGRAPWAPLLSALPVSKLLGGHLKIQYKKRGRWSASVHCMHGEQGCTCLEAEFSLSLPRLVVFYIVCIIRIGSGHSTLHAWMFCKIVVRSMQYPTHDRVVRILAAKFVCVDLHGECKLGTFIKNK
jgi:hypothetical protein